MTSNLGNALQEKVKDYDMFGHTIALNFDKKGDTYNTVVGGCCSILIKIFLISYVALCFKRLILFEKDDAITTVGLVDLSEMANVVQSTSLNMLFFYVIRKQGGLNDNDKTLSEEIEKHVEMYFEEEDADYYKPAGE